MSALSVRRVLGPALLAAALVTGSLAGCGAPSQPEETVPDRSAPEAWDLSEPETAVRSYLDWVSFAYRMANSDIPTATMTPEEAVRVDARIQLNRVEGKGVEQHLESLDIKSASEDATSAVVVARESWRYRYFSLETLAYLSEALRADYDTTYTLERGPDGWLVDKVEAVSAAEVQ